MSEALSDGMHPETCSPAYTWRDRAARGLVLRAAAHLRQGRLILMEAGTAHEFGGADAPHAPPLTIYVHRPAFYRAVLSSGVLGAGEAYMAGHWSTNDLPRLMRLLLDNAALYAALESGFARLYRPWWRFSNFLRRNTLRGSQRNIRAHYDLGNDFFRLFLDETLCYSSGYFPSTGATLLEASTAKMDKICQGLRLRATDRVLEIGAGWGGFALHAATRYGCHVTTTTISEAQFAFATQRVAEAGLQDRVTVLQEDYRHLDGCYDKLVSIEMIEAVGHRFFDVFFAQCAHLLKPEGMMALQAITITDPYFPIYVRGTDFIRRHIFPGGCLPSLLAMAQSVARVTPLRLIHQEDFGAHYAETLRRWRAALAGQLPAARALGYPDPFLRMWEYYLCLCEAGFEAREIGVSQLVYCMPGARPEPWRAPDHLREASSHVAQ